MARRLLAFVLAFIVFGAPLAGDVCRVLCAEQAVPSTPATGHAAHHHHSAAPATGRAALRSVHECDQPVAVISEFRELSRTPVVGASITVARIAPILTRA